MNQSLNAQESLYKRLGGYDAIAAVTDDFIVRQHVIDFLCKDLRNNCNISAGLLVETLNKFKVPKKEQDELLAIVVILKKDIVEVQ